MSTAVARSPAQNGLSRYGALAAALRERILAGDWPAGQALPAEARLATEFGVALGTLRQAMSLLVEQGLIERLHGRGTFVRSGLEGAPMFRFFRFGLAADEIPRSKIVSQQASVASSQVAAGLGLDPGAPVLRLLRLRSAAAQPCLLEDIWLPLPLFRGLQDDSPDMWGPLLYPEYAQRCGVHVTRVADEISFGALTAPQARQLRLASGTPCAVVTRQAFDLTGRCVEYRVTRGDAHAFHYTVTIT